MYYYKFKVFYDEVEDFVRDVDVLANSNFEDFHLFLYQCLGLQGNEFAAFSICDQKWNKQKEITLMDTSEEEDTAEEPEYDDEDSFSTKSRLPRFVMKDAILKDFITDPHQHILYEYDFIDPKTFYIEFQKVAQTDKPEEFRAARSRRAPFPCGSPQRISRNPMSMRHRCCWTSWRTTASTTASTTVTTRRTTPT